MSSFSSVVLVGHLTADPELKYLPEGPPVASFTLGVNRKFTRKDGEKSEEASFIDVDCWNKLAETCAQFLRKGRQVLVMGHIKQDRWEDRETGKKRSRLKVVASIVQFLSGGRDGEVQDEPSQAQGRPSRPAHRPATGRSRQTA